MSETHAIHTHTSSVYIEVQRMRHSKTKAERNQIHVAGAKKGVDRKRYYKQLRTAIAN